MKLGAVSGALRVLAVRDFRVSEIQKLITKVLPLLAATREVAIGTRKLTNRERRALNTLVGYGAALKKIQPDINRIDKTLGQAIDSLAKTLQGL